jgi:cytidine deaminase
MSLATYSHFRVGAVVITKDGRYHRGFNIENSSYPASMCGERCALFATYAKGYHKEDIAALGLVTSSPHVGTPCGVCRQVMSELMDLSAPVYIFNNTLRKSLFTTVQGLLPYTFTKEDLLA